MMKLYDDSIAELYQLLDGVACKVPLGEGTDWPEAENKNMILRSEMAYELGGSNLTAVGCNMVTGSRELVPKDEILLYGPDLQEIKKDISYARIALVRVKEGGLGEGNALYNGIRKIEYAKYHVNPEGFMLRISASNAHEPARVSREALKNGLDFAKVGRSFLTEYHRNPNVEAVKLIFVTLETFPFDKLQQLAKKAEKITATIDHIFKNDTMDCNVCSLKEICDEVEGMKELHFGAKNM